MTYLGVYIGAVYHDPVHGQINFFRRGKWPLGTRLVPSAPPARRFQLSLAVDLHCADAPKRNANLKRLLYVSIIHATTQREARAQPTHGTGAPRIDKTTAHLPYMRGCRGKRTSTRAWKMCIRILLTSVVLVCRGRTNKERALWTTQMHR